MKKNKAITIIAVILAAMIALGAFGINILNATTAKKDNSIILGLDLSGGVSITYQIMTENPSQTDINDTIAKLEERAENYSTEYAVYQVGEDRITVEYLAGNEKSAWTPKELKEKGFYGLDYSAGLLKAHPEWIDEAHKLGLDINVWTVNDEAEINGFFDRGVDKVTTDIPALYKKR